MSDFVLKHFSSVDYMQKLRKAKFSDEQAEILARETEELISNILEQSKNELEKKELATKSDIRESELLLQKEIAELKNQLVQWVVGTGVAGILAIAGLLKFMIH